LNKTLPFTYRIRRSEKASRARIVVKPGLVEIVAPWEIPEVRLHKFVHAKQQWITNALNKMTASKADQNNFLPLTFINGAQLTYQGKQYVLTVIPSKLKRIKVELRETIIIHFPITMPLTQADDLIKQAVVNWLKRQAKALVADIVAKHAQKKRLIPRSITIKTQKSRWGSCGIRNDININWLLMLSPVDVLEYVVVHELCHIQVKNHSKHFWSLVAEHLPDYQQRRLWLKQHGRNLMLAY
jgi:predicted metal-dependent hydrolase